jgi:hypothetical protein
LLGQQITNGVKSLSETQRLDLAKPESAAAHSLLSIVSKFLGNPDFVRQFSLFPGPDLLPSLFHNFSNFEGEGTFALTPFLTMGPFQTKAYGLYTGKVFNAIVRLNYEGLSPKYRHDNPFTSGEILTFIGQTAFNLMRRHIQSSDTPTLNIKKQRSISVLPLDQNDPTKLGNIFFNIIPPQDIPLMEGLNTSLTSLFLWNLANAQRLDGLRPILIEENKTLLPPKIPISQLNKAKYGISSTIDSLRALWD